MSGRWGGSRSRWQRRLKLTWRKALAWRIERRPGARAVRIDARGSLASRALGYMLMLIALLLFLAWLKSRVP